MNNKKGEKRVTDVILPATEGEDEKVDKEGALSLSDSVQHSVQYRPLNEKEGLTLSDPVSMKR